MSDCFHCGALVPANVQIRLDILGDERDLCCTGCEAVAEAILQSGSESFYQYRSDVSATPEFTPASLPQSMQMELALYDNQEVLEALSEVTANGRQITLIIEGITCAACAWLIEKQLKQFAGVEFVNLNLSQHTLKLCWQQAQTPLSELIARIYALGFKAQPYSPDLAQQQLLSEQKKATQRLGLAALGMMQAMMFALPLYVGDWGGVFEKFETYFRFASLIITTPVVLYSARPFFVAFWRDLKSRHLTMDVPVAIAIGGAYGASVWSTFTQGQEVYFDSVCMFTFFLLVGRFLESRARLKNSEAGNHLASVMPRATLRIHPQDNSETLVPVSQLRIGDHIRILPGATLVADGIIVEGRSSIDESIITGEFLPIQKQAGDPVIGGSLNVESPITLRVTALDKDMQISTVMSLLERATADKPKIAVLADRVAQYFVAAVLILSALVFVSWSFIDSDKAFWVTLSVLVATCPCALSLATPTALTTATSALRRHGILITRGHVLQTLIRSQRILFDKTGTLTLGQLNIDRIIPLAGSAEDALQLAASLEAHSQHPIASAFHYTPLLSVKHTQAQSGAGLEGQIDGHKYKIGLASYVLEQPPKTPDDGHWVLLARQQTPLAWFLLSDQLRSDAASTVSALQDLGLECEMLSGDHSAQVQLMAAKLNMDKVQGAVSPAGKLDYIGTLPAQDATIMVGDGINDVPVLAQAPVSIAVGSASDLAKNHADVILMSNQLHHLPLLMAQARRSARIIKQNLVWALLYNASVLPLAALGLLPPYMAAIGMSASSLVVVFNALRLNKLRP
ncbi:MAG: heavy metal translocating P-type ATPase [Bermanella sp.]